MSDPLIDIIKKHSTGMAPESSLRFLFGLMDTIYKTIGEEAIRYGDGVHPKHRLIAYHEFFITHIRASDTVLDIGCGDGTVTEAVAGKALGQVTGIDKAIGVVQNNSKRHNPPNVQYLHGDATQLDRAKDKHGLGEQDAVILSNILEHVQFPDEVLRDVQRLFKPRIALIRLPMFERDWMVPIRRELGVNYMLDDTHIKEYTERQSIDMVDSGGYEIIEMHTKWSEFWIAAEVK